LLNVSVYQIAYAFKAVFNALITSSDVTERRIA